MKDVNLFGRCFLSFTICVVTVMGIVICGISEEGAETTTAVIAAESKAVETTAKRTTETTTERLTEMTVTATAYCPCEKCCGKWAKDRSDGIKTASGAYARSKHTIAVDPSVIPFGTAVIINGIEYIAEDTGGAVKGKMIDIYFDSHEEAQAFGRQTLTVYVKG